MASLNDPVPGAAPTQPSSPGGWLGSLLHNIPGAVATGAQTLGNVLDAPRSASQQLIFQRGSSDANRAALRQAIPLLPQIYQRAGTVPFVGHAIQGAYDTALDTITDPVTYASLGSGALVKGAVKGAASLIGRGAETVARAHPLLQDAVDVAKKVPQVGQYFRPGGVPMAKVAAAHGEPTRDFLLGIKNKTAGTTAETTNRLQTKFTGLTKNVPADDFVNAMRINNNEVGPFKPAATNLAGGLKGLTDQAALLQADPRLAEQIGGELAPDLAEFKPTVGRMTLENYRGAYVPGIAEMDALQAGRPKSTINALDYENPNLRPRDNFTVDPTRVEDAKAAYLQMLANASRATGTQRLGEDVSARFGGNVPDDVRAAFEQNVPATGDARSVMDKLGGLVKGAQSYGRAGIVSLTPFHVGNIGALQLANAPSTIPGSVATTVKAMLPGADRYKLFEEGRNMGVATADAADNKPFFQNIPLAARLAGGSAIGAGEGYVSDPNLPQGERLGRAAVGAGIGAAGGAALPKWSKAMTDLTFTYDKAAKQEYAKKLAAGGAEPFTAGRQAEERLIDYTNPSALGEGMRFTSRFPNYRSQLPQAVLGAVARNPAKVEALNRATGGTLLGGETDVNGSKVKSYLSTADVGRAVPFDPFGYARSSAGDPTKMVASELGIHPPGKHGDFWATYGQNPAGLRWLIQAAAAGVPQARQILQEAGFSQFAPVGLGKEALFSTTGTSVR